jgi:DNA mismatch endonuclease, patch repair protein
MVSTIERTTPSFAGLRPASARASAAARGASVKGGTRCELVLRRELWRRGLRYRIHVAGLPGCPDIVFPKCRVVVFCDGDFWHGRDLEERLEKLANGHNASYWLTKINRNVARDRKNSQALRSAGWVVLRLWETDVLRAPSQAADRVAESLATARVSRVAESYPAAFR